MKKKQLLICCLVCCLIAGTIIALWLEGSRSNEPAANWQESVLIGLTRQEVEDLLPIESTIDGLSTVRERGGFYILQDGTVLNYHYSYPSHPFELPLIGTVYSEDWVLTGVRIQRLSDH